MIAPDQISGIEIRANGHKIAWTIADYLDSLASSVDPLLKTATETEGAEPVSMAQDVHQNGH